MSSEITWACRSFDELSNSELYGILQLRAEVFVVEQDCVYQDVDGFDQVALHVMGQRDRGEGPELVCYTRLLAPGVKYEGASIGRVVTHMSVRGGGIGKALMVKSIAYCRDRWPGVPVTISAQQHLERFYSELGFRTESEPYDEDGIPHIRMQLSY